MRGGSHTRNDAGHIEQPVLFDRRTTLSEVTSPTHGREIRREALDHSYREPQDAKVHSDWHGTH